MKVNQLTFALGAELSGIRLAEAATNDDMAGEINALLMKHKVLFIRDQDMTDAEHAGVARRFGELEDHPLAKSADGEPGIIHIWKSPESPPERYENAWHSDAAWRECPPMGAVLRCVECPPVGGDTMWANMELAFERLPDHIKEDIIHLRARHSMEASFMAAKPMIYNDNKSCCLRATSKHERPFCVYPWDAIQNPAQPSTGSGRTRF